MKIRNSLLLIHLCLVVTMLSTPQFTSAQTTNSPAEQQATKLKQKVSKALADAISESKRNNDRETAGFLSDILASLDKPEGISSNAIAVDGLRMKECVRNLVRHGALESGALVNWTQWQILVAAGQRSARSGPANPNHKTGGAAGIGGLVLYLPFDKADEHSVVHDESGAGNDGFVFGAKWVPDGKFGGAYKFQITNLDDRIVVPNSDTLNPGYITVAAWIKTADKDGFWNRIVDKDFRSAYCLDLGGDYNGKAGRGKLIWESSRDGVSSDKVLDDNQWHHVAATYDGKTAHCYVDGIEKSRSIRNGGPLKKSGWDLCIGNSVVDYGTGEFIAFDGLIDEMRIYNRALSADEIQLLVTATRAGADVVPAPQVAPNQIAPKSDVEERLKKLKSLYEQGLINKEDYDKKVKEIMDSL